MAGRTGCRQIIPCEDCGDDGARGGPAVAAAAAAAAVVSPRCVVFKALAS